MLVPSKRTHFVTLVAVGLLLHLTASLSHAALLGHWNFDNNTSNSGTTGATNDVTAVNGATYVTGPTGLGSALAVNNGTAGTVHYALVNNSATGPMTLVGTSYTWALWAKAPVGQKVDAIVVADDAADFSGGYATSYAFNLYAHEPNGNFGLGATVLPTDGAWHFYAGRYDQSALTLDLFVDMNKYTLFSGAGLVDLTSDGDDPLRFGNAAYDDFPPNPAFGYRGISNGAIDDARIYNEALSDAALATLATLVPEPSAFVLASLGLVGMVLSVCHRKGYGRRRA